MAADCYVDFAWSGGVVLGGSWREALVNAPAGWPSLARAAPLEVASQLIARNRRKARFT